MARYFLIDGTNLLYRAYHALQGFRTAAGLPTHVVYGFLSMIFRVLREHAPEGLAVVFDPPGPTARHRLFPEYKANREATPEDLIVQIPYVHRALAALGVPVLTLPGLEADDVLGTLARRLAEAGEEVTLVTGDKDFCQLVGPRIRLLDTMRDRFSGPEEVAERFGVPPERVVDVLALTGDPVDNIPGVPGIGPKTAAKLVAAYGGLEGVVARAEEVKGKRGEALREHGQRALGNRELVTIDTAVPVDAGAEDLRPRSPDRPALAALFRELELHRFLRELGLDEEGKNPGGGAGPGTDSEGAGAAAGVPEAPAGWLAVAAGEDAGLWGLARGDDAVAAPAAGIPEAWSSLLADPSVPVVGHRLQGAWSQLSRRGTELAGIALDTEVAAYLLLPGRRAYPEEDLSRERGLDPGTGGTPAERAVQRARTALGLAARLEGELAAAGLLGLYREIENPLIPVLGRMETRGVKVDAGALDRLSREYQCRLEGLERRIFDLAGEEFNPQSPRQLASVLFDKLKLPVVKKTATGYSTDAEVLEELALDHPLPRVVLEHRSLSKLKSAFIDVLPALVDPGTGRIHARFHQTVAATGRLSSSRPNLQNIPVRGDEGRRIREAFVAEEGCVLLSADYSQVELRILAHLSGDPALVAVFRAGRDVHSETASRLFGVRPRDVDDRMRREAKTVNFGILYGMSPFGLARQLGISRASARAMIDAYFQQFPSVRRYLEGLVDAARRLGYAETLFGRRRPLPELGSRNRAQRELGERMAVNTPIQGTAADLIKRAMVRADRAHRQRGSEAHLVLQVHDELVFEVAASEADEARRAVVEAMEGAAALAVPLVVDAGCGPNWYDAH
ncbi:MAG: DNA polymerase I [Deferrisomatales bacterium]|nr:DNA polymerase I [Deferrisomatales bacterium]